MEHIPSRTFYTPPDCYQVMGLVYGAKQGTPEQALSIDIIKMPERSLQKMKPKKKDPRTFIGWAFKAFFD